MRSASYVMRSYLSLIAAILLVSGVNSDPTTTDCLVPDDAQLLTQLLSSGGVVMSPPGLEEPFPSGQQERSQTGRVDPGDEQGDCPLGQGPPPGSAPVRERAACPWRYVADRDPSRYPPTVARAVSRCPACLGPGGSLVAGTRCEPVTYRTKALHQKGCGRPGGVMEYDVKDMDQTVAFQCVSIHNPK